MFCFLRKYPLSITVVLTVIYLSFFRPPSVDNIPVIPHLDKVVHLCMYMGISGVLWFELLRNHKGKMVLWRAWVVGCIFPILFSGCVELLQEYCTTYRGGDWMDFIANTAGALLGSLAGYYILRPRILKTA